MSKASIKDLLNSTKQGESVTVNGWVKAFRNDQFVQLNDGSCQENIQAVINKDVAKPEDLRKDRHRGGTDSRG